MPTAGTQEVLSTCFLSSPLFPSPQNRELISQSRGETENCSFHHASSEGLREFPPWGLFSLQERTNFSWCLRNKQPHGGQHSRPEGVAAPSISQAQWCHAESLPGPIERARTTPLCHPKPSILREMKKSRPTRRGSSLGGHTATRAWPPASSPPPTALSCQRKEEASGMGYWGPGPFR